MYSVFQAEILGIKLYYIPIHCDDSGNEVADELAKVGVTPGQRRVVSQGFTKLLKKSLIY